MTERELISRANRGDEQAMTRLYEQNRSFVLNLASRYLDDRHEAEDVLQETFSYLFAKFPGFELTCELRTFLFPVVRNKSISRLRKKRPQLNGEQHSLQDSSDGRDEQSQRRKVTEMVASLADEHRQVVLLRFVDGMSMEEIAQSLMIPKGTVKSRLHNALAKLRNAKDFIILLSLLELADF